MSDIKTVYDPTSATFDWQLENGQLSMDDTPSTAVILSMFTDRRAEESDEIPDGSDDRRGWWGDTFPEKPGDVYGSRLWLYARNKDHPATLEVVREAAEQACAWLTDDGVAARVEAEAARLRSGVLSLTVAITRPDRTRTDIRFADLWEAL
jgi:phage gp46-like protein